MKDENCLYPAALGVASNWAFDCFQVLHTPSKNVYAEQHDPPLMSLLSIHLIPFASFDDNKVGRLIKENSNSH